MTCDVVIYDPFAGGQLSESYGLLAGALAVRGVQMRVALTLEEVMLDRAPVVMHEDDERFVPEGDRVVLGQRLLNRQERLRALDGLGVPIVPWCAPLSNEEWVQAGDTWQVDSVVVKKDKACDRQGVQLSSISAGLPEWFDAKRDVVMMEAQGEAATIKVDLFGASIVWALKLITPSLRDASFRTAEYPYDMTTIPFDTELAAQKIGAHLQNFGAGYLSVDFMQHEDHLHVIEVNVCAVSRILTWPYWKARYLERYADGLAEWLRGGGGPLFGVAVGRAREVALSARR